MDTTSPGLLSEHSLTYIHRVPRAFPLPPEQRRAGLVDAARDLIAAQGQVPSTKEIAEAAGVAEGTIFRVFATKDDLLDAVIASTFCPAVFHRRLNDLDSTLPLRERLVAIVTLLQRRFVETFGIMGALGLTAPPHFPPGAHDGCTPELGHVGTAAPTGADPHASGGKPATADRYKAEKDRRTHELLRFLEPDADRFRCTPAELLRYLRLLTFAGSHHGLTEGEMLGPSEIVDVILDGVLLEPEPPRRDGADRSTGSSEPGRAR